MKICATPKKSLRQRLKNSIRNKTLIGQLVNKFCCQQEHDYKFFILSTQGYS